MIMNMLWFWLSSAKVLGDGRRHKFKHIKYVHKKNHLMAVFNN